MRRRQAAFQRRRYSSLLVWACLGGAAVLGGAFVAHRWSQSADEQPLALPKGGDIDLDARSDATLMPTPDTASRVSAVPAATPEQVRQDNAVPASGADKTHAEAAPTTAHKAPQAARSGARPKPSARSLSLDELPTE